MNLHWNFTGLNVSNSFIFFKVSSMALGIKDLPQCQRSYINMGKSGNAKPVPVKSPVAPFTNMV